MKGSVEMMADWRKHVVHRFARAAIRAGKLVDGLEKLVDCFAGAAVRQRCGERSKRHTGKPGHPRQRSSSSPNWPLLNADL